MYKSGAVGPNRETGHRCSRQNRASAARSPIRRVYTACGARGRPVFRPGFGGSRWPAGRPRSGALRRTNWRSRRGSRRLFGPRGSNERRPSARRCRPGGPTGAQGVAASAARLQKRWLFIWRDMSDPKEVDRMIARFPRAQADGYNGVAFSYNVPPAKAAGAAAGREAERPGPRRHRDGRLARPQLRRRRALARTRCSSRTAGRRRIQPDNPTQVMNADFEDVDRQPLQRLGAFRTTRA